MRETRRFRGISRRLAVQYLETLGGERVVEADTGDVDEDDPGDDTQEGADVVRVTGDGWTASLSAEPVDVAGSITLTEVTVVFEGDAEAVDPLVERFARKAVRAGG